MLKRSSVLVLAASALLAAGSKDDKTTAPISVKVSLDKPELPVPVKLAFSTAIAFCIKPGLNSRQEPVRVNLKLQCPGTAVKVGANLDDIVSAFSKDTEHTITQGDKFHILVFCNAKVCGPSQGNKLRDVINELAKPSPRYFEDVDVPSGVKPEALAAAVAKMSDGVTGRVISPKRIRLQTDQHLDPVQLANLRNQIKNATPDTLKNLPTAANPIGGERIQMPFFCVSNTLDGPPPAIADSDKPCKPDQRRVPASNASDIVALSRDKLKITNDTNSSLIVSCGASKCDGDALDLLNASIAATAHPAYSYFKDLPVLPNTSEAAAANIKKWSGGAIRTEVLSDSIIRLKSDVPVSSADVETFDRRLLDEGFSDYTAPPVKQLFYRDAGSVVSELGGSPVSTSALAPGLTAPITSPPASGAPSGTPAATPQAHPASTYASGMTAVGDSVVFTSATAVTDHQRARLLALLDLPRPEVLMNMWSLQESSPSGKDLADESQAIRSAVSAHNDALQNAIEYGWSYLSRRMQQPGYFDTDFANYLTQRFVSEPARCATHRDGPGCISQPQRDQWGLCGADSYCLGYTEAFSPLKPTLTNILLGLMAAKREDAFHTVFTTVGCMEGNFPLYGNDCFPERPFVETALNATGPALAPPARGLPAGVQACRVAVRRREVDAIDADQQLSCEDLDRADLTAQRECHMAVTLPLSCFLVQAAKSFVPYHGFSTFPLRQLNNLDNKAIAGLASELPPNEASLSSTPMGLLRAATTNFLFNYKMALQYPKDFSPYSLAHSAQELNAEFNPLVVAFNQDVAAFSRQLMTDVQNEFHDSHWYKPWRGANRSAVADGLVTVRGISGIETLVDTETQSAFSAPQYQTLSNILSNLAAGSSGSPAPASTTGTIVNVNTAPAPSTPSPDSSNPAAPGLNLQTLLPGALTRTSLPLALSAAVTPSAAKAQIGRQLTLDITPHTLPGASSAELDVKLWAQEDSPPALYKDGAANSQTDPLSRVARHNVFTKVRVESVKLFEVSSFSALVQRPRTKVPIIPPLVEIPLIGDLIGLPLPGAKVFHRSTAIVSAIIVPTAADLGFGIEFADDRAVVGQGVDRAFRTISSFHQLPWQQQRLPQFNQVKATCFATNAKRAIGGAVTVLDCKNLTFANLPPDR